jgi:TolB-like protein
MKKAMILIFAVCFTVTAFAQTKPRLAILPITGGTGGDGETIAELFSFDPDINRVFVPVPRTGSVEAIMREQQFQSSTGLTDADTIARLGMQSNADYVVAGHIQVLGDRNLVLITIIHVVSFQQIAGDYRQYGSIEEIQDMIPDMARRIARAAQLDRTNLPRLAVLPFSVSTSGVNQNDAEVLAQILATEVANSGRYVVLPRTSLIQTVLREHEIQRSGRTEQDSIKAIGEALNAQYVLSGNVRSLGQNNIFTALILETENGEQVKGAFENYNTVADGLTHIATLSRKLLGTDTYTASEFDTPAPLPSDAWKYYQWYSGFSAGYAVQLNRGDLDYLVDIPFGFSIYARFQPSDLFGIALDLSGDLLDGPIISIAPTLTIRPFLFEINFFLGIGGHIYYDGALAFTGGIRAGYKAGPGVLYAELRASAAIAESYIYTTEYINNTFEVSSYRDYIPFNISFTLGYQIGFGSQRKR